MWRSHCIDSETEQDKKGDCKRICEFKITSTRYWYDVTYQHTSLQMHTELEHYNMSGMYGRFVVSLTESTVLCTLAPPHTPKDFDFVSSSMPSPYTIRSACQSAEHIQHAPATLHLSLFGRLSGDASVHTILRHARHFHKNTLTLSNAT